MINHKKGKQKTVSSNRLRNVFAYSPVGDVYFYFNHGIDSDRLPILYEDFIDNANKSLKILQLNVQLIYLGMNIKNLSML